LFCDCEGAHGGRSKAMGGDGEEGERQHM